MDLSAFQAEHFAGRKHHFQTRNVITRRPILERSRPGRVSRNSPAEKAAALSRIRWIQQPFTFNRLLKVRQDHARLRLGDAILSINMFDSIQPIRG